MIRAILGILGLGMTLMVTHVQAAVVAPDSAFATFYSRVTAPGKQTIGFGSNGTPVVASGVPSVSSAGGPVQVVRTASLPLPSGARLPVTATAKISNVAISALVKKALPLVPLLGTGVALYDLAKELGYLMSKDAVTGQVSVLRQGTSTICNVDYGLSSYAQTAGVTSTKVCIPVSAGSTVYTYGWSMSSVQFAWPGASFPCGNATCQTGYVYRGVGNTADVTPASEPSSLQQLADSISAKSGWPTGSAVSQAVVDAQRVTGDQIPTEQPTITGPASVAGPVSVSTTPYQDMVKKSTKASNYDCTYVQGDTVMEGGSAICTERSVTTDELTKTDPATGVKTTTTTTSEDATKPADIPKDTEQATASDTPLPSQPTLYKRQYPDGLTGVWTAKKASLTSSPLIQLTTSLQPTIAAPSGYPSWPIPFVIGSKNWGTFDVSPAPYIWDFLKVCTILGALFLARALIFGG